MDELITSFVFVWVSTCTSEQNTLPGEKRCQNRGSFCMQKCYINCYRPQLFLPILPAELATWFRGCIC